MRRFYCQSENIKENTVYFDRDESKHIAKVLRLEKGDEIIVSTGDGMDNYCVLASTGEECTAIINKTVKNENEPNAEIILFQSVIKNEKMDFLVQKVSELGITKIVPIITERTVVKIEDAKKEEKKQERWQKIALEACKQCGRSRIPEVLKAIKLKDAKNLFDACSEKIVCYEEEKTQSITETIKKTECLGYFIGPEGGITEDEHKFLKEQGFVSVSLGKRILRAETAAIATGAVVLALMGEMNV